MIKYHWFVFLILISWKSVAQERSYNSYIELAQSFEASNPDSVLFYARQALKVESENQSDAYYWMGVGHRLKRNLDSASTYYRQSLSLAKTDIQKANGQMGLGGVNYSLREWDDALGNFLSAAKLYESLGRMDRLGAAYSNIGIIMNVNDNDEKARFYFLESIRIFDRIGLEDKKLPSLVNIAGLFHKNEQYDSAIFYAEQCYNISKEKNFAFGMSQALINMAPSFIEIGRPKHGYQLAVEGEKLFTDLGISQSALLMKFYQGQALTRLNRASEAINIFKDLEETTTEISGQERLYRWMARAYEQLDDFSNALTYQRKFHQAYEDYTTEEKAAYLDELEKKYESEKKERDIVALQNRVALEEAKASRKNWIIFSIVIITILLISSGWFYYQKKLSKEEEQTAIHKQQLLRSQINPHFIFNSLLSIRGFLFENRDVKPAITYLGKFAKLMRMILELSSREWVALDEEVNALELYLDIQRLRFNRAFDFKLSVDSSLRMDEILVPPLTAQPFIENAIEHGLKGIENHGVVEIECLKQDRKLVFKIQDNGIGIDHVAPKENHQSHAIRIFKERLSIIGKRMKMNFFFRISDLGNQDGQHGTLVTYELPLLKT